MMKRDSWRISPYAHSTSRPVDLRVAFDDIAERRQIAQREIVFGFRAVGGVDRAVDTTGYGARIRRPPAADGRSCCAAASSIRDCLRGRRFSA